MLANTTCFNFSLIEEHFDDMKPLVELDPLFLPMVVYICPAEELSMLFLQIPPFVSAARLSTIISLQTGRLNKHQVGCDYLQSVSYYMP